MALEKYHIARISYATAMDAVIRHHYLHRKAPCSVAFGLFLGDALRYPSLPYPKTCASPPAP